MDCWQSFGLTWLNTAAHHRITKTERSSSSPKAEENWRDAKNGWSIINLLDHLGKAYSRGLIQPNMPKIASRMHRCQFGALPCRGTREAILLVKKMMERFRSMARHRKSSQRPLRKMAALLFDSEKSFDCIPRGRAFSELAILAGSAARISGRPCGVPHALQCNHGRGQGYER